MAKNNYTFSINLPKSLDRLAGDERSKEWAAGLGSLVDELANQWSLTLGDAYPDSSVSFVAPARQDGELVVLKVQWPHEECRFEADALQCWDGNGAINLLAHDRERHALLLEPCSPGTHLSRSEARDPVGVMIDLLPKLWIPAEKPFKSLTQEATEWQNNLYENWEISGRRCEKMLIDATYTLISDFSKTQGEQVLVHQDLHGDNVLAARRADWLAIDPKPLIGEREFALSPVIRSFEFGEEKADLYYRLDRLTSELSLNRERARGWAIVQSIAWGFDGDYFQEHHQTAQWLLDRHPHV